MDTIERPLHLGAALADLGSAARDALTAYALPLGDAFQLRDDLLGVFGDPAETGKSRLDDLRAGNCAILMALALQRADESQERRLRALVGRPDLDEEEAAEIRNLLETIGARGTVEQMIFDRRRQALRALALFPFPPAAAAALRWIAEAATSRTA